MTVEYLDLFDCLALAAEVTGLDNETVTRVAQLDLADLPSPRRRRASATRS